MSKRYVIAALAALLIAVPVGAVGTSKAIESEPCEKPRMLMDFDRQDIGRKIEDFIEARMTGGKPLFKTNDLELVGWDIMVDSETPGKIAGAVMVGDETNFLGEVVGDVYSVTVVRECAGGEWRVVKLKKQPPAKKRPGQGVPAIP